MCVYVYVCVCVIRMNEKRCTRITKGRAKKGGEKKVGSTLGPIFG